MIKKLRMSNFGPHKGDVVFEMDKGPNWFQGPNESGKTTMLTAVAFCLTGCDEFGKKVKPEHIHAGTDALRSEITTWKDTLLGRSLSREGTETIYFRKAGDLEETVCAPKKFRESNKLPEDDLLLSILVPRYALGVLGEGNASRLRDLLERNISGAGDLETEVKAAMMSLGHTPASDRFTTDIKKAEEARKDAKKRAVDLRAKNAADYQRIDQLTEELKNMKVPEADPTTPTQRQVDDARVAVAQIEKEIREILQRPNKTEAYLELRAKQQRMQSNVRALTHQVETLKDELRCHMCRQVITDKDAKAKFAGQLKQATDQAHAITVDLAQMDADFERNRELDLKAAEARKLRAVTAYGDLQVAYRSSGDTERAVFEEKTRMLTQIKGEYAEGIERQKALDGWEKWHEAMVQACRIAPARLAQARVDKLGNMPDTKILFLSSPERGEPFVKLEYKGLEARLASDGAELAVDLNFRAALRLAANVPWLPMFVDRCESVGSDRIQTPPGQSFFLAHVEGAPGLIKAAGPIGPRTAEPAPKVDAPAAPTETPAKSESKSVKAKDKQLQALVDKIEVLLKIEEQDAKGPTNTTREVRSRVAVAIDARDIGLLQEQLAFLKGEVEYEAGSRKA